MTREELKEHCKRQVQQFERVEKIMSVTSNAWKRYEEHRLILELLEQEPVLDKIRTEIEQEYNLLSATRADETLELGECLGLKMALKIINKYKAESEDKE